MNRWNSPKLALTFLLLLLCLGCARTEAPVRHADPTLSVSELWREALVKAENRDYTGALIDARAATDKEPTLRHRLGVAHLLFLNGERQKSVEAYRQLVADPALAATERSAIETEIERLENAGEKSAGRSLAGQWIRAELATGEAEAAIARGDFVAAYKSYDKAYQYNRRIDFLFESALAASRSEEWQWAFKKYKEYLAVGKNDVPREMKFRIAAEIDRIEALLKGKDVVTQKSLAEEILAEREGAEEVEQLPPSLRNKAQTDEQKKDSEADIVAAEAPQSISEAPPSNLEAPKKPAAESKPAEPNKKVIAESVDPQSRSTAKPEPKEKKPVEIAATQQPVATPVSAPEPEETAVTESAPVSSTAAMETTFEDLVFYSQSRSATVRYRAVRELIPIVNETSRIALEERIVKDRNMLVRFLAISGLVQRNSIASLPVLEYALMTSATSQERAVLKRAIDDIRLGGR